MYSYMVDVVSVLILVNIRGRETKIMPLLRGLM